MVGLYFTAHDARVVPNWTREQLLAGVKLPVLLLAKARVPEGTEGLADEVSVTLAVQEVRLYAVGDLGRHATVVAVGSLATVWVTLAP